MAQVKGIVLRNYRRFRGEIELPLSGGFDIIQIRPGMGKSSIAEAVAWCIAGNMPRDEVMNIEGRMSGEETAVSLSFLDQAGTILERSISHSTGGVTERAVVHPGGDHIEVRERLFPPACVESNIISGASLRDVLRGGRTGAERAVEHMRRHIDVELLLRASMEATSLYLAMVPEPSVEYIMFNEQGRPELRCLSSMLSNDEQLAIVLAAALAFAKESCPDVPIILDEPLEGMGQDTSERAARAMMDFMGGHQVILLSDGGQFEVLRSTGKVGKEMEIKG